MPSVARTRMQLEPLLSINFSEARWGQGHSQHSLEGMTNQRELLDEALLQPGCLETQIESHCQRRKVGERFCRLSGKGEG